MAATVKCAVGVMLSGLVRSSQSAKVAADVDPPQGFPPARLDDAPHCSRPPRLFYWNSYSVRGVCRMDTRVLLEWLEFFDWLELDAGLRRAICVRDAFRLPGRGVF